MNATPLRILIVDDHADNALMLKVLLKKEGYETRHRIRWPRGHRGGPNLQNRMSCCSTSGCPA